MFAGMRYPNSQTSSLGRKPTGTCRCVRVPSPAVGQIFSQVPRNSIEGKACSKLCHWSNQEQYTALDNRHDYLPDQIRPAEALVGVPLP